MECIFIQDVSVIKTSLYVLYVGVLSYAVMWLGPLGGEIINGKRLNSFQSADSKVKGHIYR